MTPDLQAHIAAQVNVRNGWTTAERGVEMAQLILDTKPEVVVELGTFAGRSLIAQAIALQQNGKGKIYGIDPWKKDDTQEGENEANCKWWASIDLEAMHVETMQAVWNLKLDDYVVIIRSASQRVPHLFPGNIDVLVIDANHSEVASCRDVELYAPQLAPGGFAWMDDTDWASTHAAQKIMETYCTEVRKSPDGHYKLYQRK